MCSLSWLHSAKHGLLAQCLVLAEEKVSLGLGRWQVLSIFSSDKHLVESFCILVLKVL